MITPAEHGHDVIVQVLLWQGAAIDRFDDSLCTALGMAC
jgi:hypothetical protein